MTARLPVVGPETRPDDDGARFAVSVDRALQDASRALDAADHQTARGLAQSALLAAKAAKDLRAEAKALSWLAHCDRVMQRLRRASDTARRAVQLSQRVGDPENESSALNTLSHACMLLGRADEAVEAAMLSVALCDVASPTPVAVVAHNCLAMAHCWSGNFDKAGECLDTAVHLAARCQPPVSPYQPLLNVLWLEAARCVDARYRTGRLPSLTRMGELVEACRQLERAGDTRVHLPGMLPIGRTISLSLMALFSAWRGDFDDARSQAERALGSLGGTTTWLDGLVHWVVAELAWAQSDWPAAEAALAEMRTCAIKVEHEQLACLAHLLLIQVLEGQAKWAAVAVEHRSLRSRERRMASESLKSREALVKWQFRARRHEQRLARALETSRQFERWSLEDPLTGIANRRRFDQVLAERLAVAVADRRPLTVAMIDIDRFKAVNDTFNHKVGDEVLRTLAALLTSTVRENDLAARLAGDEFVVLFSDAAVDEAEEICTRIRHAIAAFDWDAIAPGLRVSVSLGLSQAVDGDTAGAIVHRSDTSMYADKPGAMPTPSTTDGAPGPPLAARAAIDVRRAG